MSLMELIEQCRQQQEKYLIEKNKEPVQLSLDLARAKKEATKVKDATP